MRGALGLRLAPMRELMKDPVPVRFVLILCSLALCGTARGQLLTVESWVSTPASPVTGPFFPSESIDVQVVGLDPLQPFSLILGAPLTPPVPLPGVAGMLGLAPSSLLPVGPFDGLGVLGTPTLGIRSSAAGTFSARITLPRFAQFLPVTFALQVIARTAPTTPGPALVLSNTVPVTLVAPPAPPSILAVFPSVLKEGVTPMPSMIMQGAQFFDRISVPPRVFFTPADGSPVENEATSVQVIDADSGPLRDPLLVVTPPSRVGPPMVPPQTSAGPMRIRVSYEGLGIYAPSSPNASFITSPNGLSDPSIVVYQTGIRPVVTGISPMAGLTTQSCTVTLNVADVLDPPLVIFIGAGAASVAANARFEGDSSIVAETTNFATPGRHLAFIRNPDHHPVSSAQSTGSPVIEFFVFEPGAESAVDITSVSPASMVEGSGPTSVTLSGTCPSVDGFSLLSPSAGTLSVLMGSRLGTEDRFIEVPVTSVMTPAPGLFSITVLVPSDPPGLNSLPSANAALSNTGTKHFLIVTAPCVNPNGNRHEDFSTVAAAEPGNRFVYESANAPMVTGVTPVPVTRLGGGQEFTLNGLGFLTNANAVPSGSPSLGPSLSIEAAQQTVPISTSQIVSENAINFTMPDLSAALQGVSLPTEIRILVTNPDGQNSPDVVADNIQVRPSLVPPVSRTIDFSGPDPIVVLDTGPQTTPLSIPNNTWVELNDFAIPAGRTLTAFGAAPLILRVRGNLRIDGTLDLRGSRFRVLPAPPPPNWPSSSVPPAGGGRGGGFPPSSSVGANALGPINPSGIGASQYFGTGGFGGAHDVRLGGGGGGGGMANQGDLGGGALTMPTVLLGGAGGGALILPTGTALPFPVLGAPDPILNDYQPFGGGGGGSGGFGIANYLGAPQGQLTDGGIGGHGGGSALIACDGTITVGASGRILLDGESGEAGRAGPGMGMQMEGGGGGAGSGGGLVLQSLHGIIIENGGIVTAAGGTGGIGGRPGVNDGGDGSAGIIRFALPITTPAIAPQILSAPLTTPVPDTTGF